MTTRSRLLLLVGLVALAAPVQAGIDFTPTISRYRSEGAEHSSVSFKDDKRTVSLLLPRRWTCHGDASRLQFVPPDQSFAEGVIQALPGARAKAFDGATLKTLEAQLMSELPPGSQGAAIISRQENPVLLYQNLSYEFVVSYQTLGQSFQRSVVFVNTPEAQLVFRFTAPQPAFANLNGAFRRSICSWEWIEPAASVAATASR